MVLDIKYSVLSNAEKILLSDEGSVWDSPAKNTVAVTGIVRHNKTNNREFILVDPKFDPTADNNDITSFEAEYVSDGWYTLAIAVIPTDPSPAEGVIRFNESTLLLEIYQDGDWAELTDPELILTSESLVVSIKEVLLYSKHTIKINCLWLDIVNNKCKDKKCSLDVFWFSRGQLFAALNQFAMGNRFESQRMIENIEKTVERI